MKLIPTIATVSVTGTIPDGALALSIIFSSDFAGTVGGATFAGGDAPITFPAIQGRTYGPISVTRSAGSLRVVRVQ